jgi:hypothetical protein
MDYGLVPTQLYWRILDPKRLRAHFCRCLPVPAFDH